MSSFQQTSWVRSFFAFPGSSPGSLGGHVETTFSGSTLPFVFWNRSQALFVGLFVERDDHGDLALLHVDTIGRFPRTGDHFLVPLPTHQVHYHKARMCSRAVQ